MKAGRFAGLLFLEKNKKALFITCWRCNKTLIILITKKKL